MGREGGAISALALFSTPTEIVPQKRWKNFPVVERMREELERA